MVGCIDYECEYNCDCDLSETECECERRVEGGTKVNDIYKSFCSCSCSCSCISVDLQTHK